MSVTTKLDLSGIERFEREFPARAEALVDKVAFDVQGRAQNMAPVDTGALRNSIYTVTRKSDGYRNAASAIKAANPEAETAPLPIPDEELVAHVGPSVEYAIYQELGTSRMAARPFLIPAVEQLRNTWKQAWKELFRSMA